MAFAGASCLVTDHAVLMHHGVHSLVGYGAVESWGVVPFAVDGAQVEHASQRYTDFAACAC